MAAREVELDDLQFALISKAVAEPKRFEMLQKIGASTLPPTCSCLGDCVDLSPATVSHHLKELENAGLISIERNGKFAHVSLRRDVWAAYLTRLSML
jgi:ArsR family transcriptional regulator, arsenate/arsenite/antimonite-responsive transcriptional repressor